MLINMSIKIIHDFFELLLYFDFFRIWCQFAVFRFDKNDGFDGIFLDRLISFSIKELKLSIGFFLKYVFCEFMMGIYQWWFMG